MMPNTVHFRIVIQNPEPMNDLEAAAAILHDLAEDMPWRPEIGEAAEMMCRAARGLRLERSHA